MLKLNEPQLSNGPYTQLVGLMNAGDHLLEKIHTRQANVAIIGLGYVGLPLAMAFADAGFDVTGIDIDAKRVQSLNAGHSHTSDVSSERLAQLVANRRKTDRLNGVNGNNGAHGATNGDQIQSPSLLSTNGHTNGHEHTGETTESAVTETWQAEESSGAIKGSFRATNDYDALFDMDAVIICVPTPLSSTKDPDMSFIITAGDEIARRLHHGMLIVLESTTYPGTTEEILLPRLQRVKVDRATLKVGADFFLGFSPERIDPGRTDWTVRTTPKVMGGATPRCLEMAQTLYGCAIDTVVPVSSTSAAEMVKLLENTFRAVNIAMINEVAIMCDRLGVDVWEVIEAAKTKPFGFMPFYPGPGLGGHCIPIDPRYLAWKMKTLNYNARFIQLAEEVNFNMPPYVVTKIADALNANRKSVNQARVLILGMAYKADVSDLRESPALDIFHLLHEKGALVAYHDPHVARLMLDGRSIASVALTEEVLATSDCVVIATAHSSFDWQWIVDHCDLIVDTRNVTAKLAQAKAHIVKL
jgi:UDP-N-acetyl-D-glucosamine dehydrogenase